VKVDDRHVRTIALASDGLAVEIVDQRRLPHAFEIVRLSALDEVVRAIREMWVRGAPAIGVTAAYGLWLAVRADPSDRALDAASHALVSARPTAVNLAWAVDRVESGLRDLPESERTDAARRAADTMAEEDVRICEAIGEHGPASSAASRRIPRRTDP